MAKLTAEFEPPPHIFHPSVLIDLKSGKLTVQGIGQMDIYVRNDGRPQAAAGRQSHGWNHSLR